MPGPGAGPSAGLPRVVHHSPPAGHHTPPAGFVCGAPAAAAGGPAPAPAARPLTVAPTVVGPATGGPWMHIVRMSSAPGSHAGSAQTSTQAPSDSHFDLERAPSMGSSSRSLPRETPRQFGSLAAALLRCESGETVPRLRAGDSVDMEGFLRGGVGGASSAGGASTMRSTASSRSHSLPMGGGDGTASSAGAHVPQSCFSRSSMSSSMASSVSGLSNPRGSGASFNFAGISTPLTSTHFQDPVGVVREHVQRLCADMENGGKAVNLAAAVADQCVSQECREEERASFASFSSMDQSYGGGALTSRKLSPGQPGRLARDSLARDSLARESLGPAEAIGSAAAARTSRSSGKAALHVGVEHGLEDGGVACDGPNPFSSLGALTDICNGGASSGIFANLANLSGILPAAGVEPAEPDAQSELVHSKAAELAAILAEISSLSRAQKESEVAVLAERRRLSEEQSVMRAEYEQAEHRAYQLQAEESAAAEGFQRRVDRERRRRKDQREALEQTGLLCEQLELQLEEKGRALRSAEEREEHQESQICTLTEQVRLLEVQAEEKPATARRRLFASPANEDSGLPVSEENSMRSARSAGSGWIPLDPSGRAAPSARPSSSEPWSSSSGSATLRGSGSRPSSRRRAASGSRSSPCATASCARRTPPCARPWTTCSGRGRAVRATSSMPRRAPRRSRSSAPS